MSELVKKIEREIQSQFEGDSTGHDWHHIQRVLRLSQHIQSHEGGDKEVVELAALLHDISDHKFNGGKLNAGGEIAFALLIKNGCEQHVAEKVKYIVDNISYKGANTKAEMNSLEGQIVQDADRIDAIGAIGIGRTFAYGGYNGQAMHDPQKSAKLHDSFEDYAKGNTSTINHFYEKLLLLSARLNTETAKAIGKQRHDYMIAFLDQFYSEWNFGTETD